MFNSAYIYWLENITISFFFSETQLNNYFPTLVEKMKEVKLFKHLQIIGLQIILNS